MRLVFQFPASMTSVVDAPRLVSSDASPTRPECAVTRRWTPAFTAAAVNRNPIICADNDTTWSPGFGVVAARSVRRARATPYPTLCAFALPARRSRPRGGPGPRIADGDVRDVWQRAVVRGLPVPGEHRAGWRRAADHGLFGGRSWRGRCTWAPARIVGLRGPCGRMGSGASCGFGVDTKRGNTFDCARQATRKQEVKRFVAMSKGPQKQLSP